MNSAEVNYFIGIMLMVVVCTFFPDYTLPIVRENIWNAIGQVLVFAFGAIIFLNEAFRTQTKLKEVKKCTKH